MVADGHHQRFCTDVKAGVTLCDLQVPIGTRRWHTVLPVLMGDCALFCVTVPCARRPDVNNRGFGVIGRLHSQQSARTGTRMAAFWLVWGEEEGRVGVDCCGLILIQQRGRVPAAPSPAISAAILGYR